MVRIVGALFVTSAIIVLALLEIYGGFDKSLSRNEMLAAIKEELRKPPFDVQSIDIDFTRRG
jgi:hypothetical protein